VDRQQLLVLKFLVQVSHQTLKKSDNKSMAWDHFMKVERR
jgi:hypothetical protein